MIDNFIVQVHNSFSIFFPIIRNVAWYKEPEKEHTFYYNELIQYNPKYLIILYIGTESTLYVWNKAIVSRRCCLKTATSPFSLS